MTISHASAAVNDEMMARIHRIILHRQPDDDRGKTLRLESLTTAAGWRAGSLDEENRIKNEIRVTIRRLVHLGLLTTEHDAVRNRTTITVIDDNWNNGR